MENRSVDVVNAFMEMINRIGGFYVGCTAIASILKDLSRSIEHTKGKPDENENGNPKLPGIPPEWL